MATFVALLRAVNVGGRNQLSMTELRALFESFGYSHVETYIQSGNVVFDGASRKSALVASEVEAAFADALGRPLDVVIRSAREMSAVIKANPFLGRVPDPTKLHVVFLNHAPDEARVNELDVSRFEPEEFALGAREVYLHCPDGLGRSKLSAALAAKLTPMPSTVRNWNTVNKLAALAKR
ncbi:MAG TPA: DUF1697 domain-containing protein [Acidimicrobiales bacterium]|nr:DUF1697 domain-containing protein [Acidimicrobiales bacterium]